MRRLNRLVRVVAAMLVVAVSSLFVPASAGAQPGPLPGAGQQFGPTVIPPVPLLYALQHDPARRFVWAGTEASRLTAGLGDLYLLDHTRGYSVITSLVTDELQAPGVNAPQIDGPINELALLGNGELLCADFNGDLTRFDDTIFLLDVQSPPSPVLNGVWYVDDLGCPGNCAVNGNTNTPKDRIDFLAGLAVRRTYGITATNQSRQQIFVGQYLPTSFVREIELTPGTAGGPGTWATRRMHVSPTGDSVDGIDWDPDLQSFWMTSTTTGLVYEVKLDDAMNRFRVVQSFPSTGVGGAIAVTALRDSQLPHVLVEGEGFSFTGSLTMTETGHVGRGTPQVGDPVGPSTISVGILMDADCAGLPFRVLVAFSNGIVQLGERYLELQPDPLFMWSLTDPLFAGTLNTAAAGSITIPVTLPANFGPIHIQVVIFGNPDENLHGIKRLSTRLQYKTR